MTVVLDGRSLTLAQVCELADGAPVAIHPDATVRMARSRLVVERYLRESIPAYGLTTGLGMRAGVMLSADEATQFSYRTVRGRAQALGPPLSGRSVRAVMVARLNTMLDGSAGASAAVAPFMVEVLNRGLVPVMPGIGSIGSGDLVAMASMAHAFIGEGRMLADGRAAPAAQILATAGLAPLALLPKDGAVLCNNTAFSTGLAALAALAARTTLEALQVAGALSLEGFRGNSSPFGRAVLRLRPQPGQVAAGDAIRALLMGGELLGEGAARRLQDPLSLRCMAQVNGAAFAALDDLDHCILVELNSSPDNPAVLVDEGVCVTTGNFHLSRLAQTLDSAARSLAWCATDSVSRVQRLMSAATSALPPLLSSDDGDRAGFGPLLKPMEALRAHIIHLSNPVPVMASHNADGIEDSATFAALAAQKLAELLTQLRLLVAAELIAAAQAVDLRGTPISPALQRVHGGVRQLSAFIDADRPIGSEIEAVAQQLEGLIELAQA